MIDAAIFKALQAPGKPALSVYFPLDPRQTDLRGPAARLRALAVRAAEGLAAHGVGAEQAEELLGALDEIAGGLDLAHHRDQGFGFFATPRWSRMVTLPVSIPEALVVGSSFHLKPLLPLISRNLRFAVLALSAGDARLYAATPYAWEELALDILPDALEAGPLDAGPLEAGAFLPGAVEALAETQNAPAGSRRRGGARAVEAAARDGRHAELLEDVGRVANAVRRALADDTAPLVLAAEASMVGHFRRLARLPQLHPQALTGNPFALAPGELHARATELMRPVLDDAPEAVLEQVRARLGSAEPSVGIRFEEILARAREGRVEAIVVAEDQALWGAGAGATAVVAHGHQVAAEPDLLNEAAVETLRHGGRAYALPLERLPRHVPAVAVYRF